jgi:hypothetical protein
MTTANRREGIALFLILERLAEANQDQNNEIAEGTGLTVGARLKT